MYVFSDTGQPDDINIREPVVRREVSAELKTRVEM
jgi:hypothetical protein